MIGRSYSCKKRRELARISIVLLPAIFFISFIYGQPGGVTIERRICSRDLQFPGKKLIIHFNTDSGEITSDFHYWFGPFIELPDTIKLRIVEKLLTFREDTSTCCIKVVNRSFNGIEGCGGKPEDVDWYDIQIDALFMINRLCWPRTMEFFSCVPVLYDIKKHKAINDDPRKIKVFFNSYIKWYKSIKPSGKIPSRFPFNYGRYVWYHGRKWAGNKLVMPL
jgi:hypothetical protein